MRSRMSATRLIRPWRRRHTPGTMNSLEVAYAERLEALRATGQISSWRFEALKLRLADRTYYTPDFLVVAENTIELHEVKGHWEDDARVKWKVAAEQYPWFKFVAVMRVRREWKIEVYGETRGS